MNQDKSIVVQGLDIILKNLVIARATELPLLVSELLD